MQRAVSLDAQLIIVDGYQFRAAYLQGLASHGCFTCYVDDLMDQRYECQAVLNQNFYAKESSFERGAGCELLLGARYALVREEFLAARATRIMLSPPADPARLLVTFGGADLAGATLLVLRALSAVEVPLAVQVVIGAANPHAAEIESLARNSPRHEVAVLHAVEHMGKLMAWADLGIVAGGTTLMEVCCVGLPALVLEIADNQRVVASTASELGLVRSLGWHESVQPHAIAAAVDGFLSDEQARLAMFERQRAMVDGRGSARVVRELLSAAERRRRAGEVR